MIAIYTALAPERQEECGGDNFFMDETGNTMPAGLAFCRKTTHNSSNDLQSSDRRLLSELRPLYGRIVARAVFGAWRINATSVVSATGQPASMRAFSFARKSFNYSSHAKGVTG
jgi:hypothetical protein